MPDYIALMLAYSLDLVMGDPVWLPHPVRLMGFAIEKTEGFLRPLLKANSRTAQGLQERIAGVFLVIVITGSTYLIMHEVEKGFLAAADSGHLVLKTAGAFFLVYLISATLATKGLTESAQKVIRAAKNGDITTARESLSRIVGRDTASLDDKAVLKASIESLAENASDGIIAPLFYFLIGGLPLSMAYKAINTMDSMVGYRNERYIHFGWAAARLDDIANYIPARITGILIAAASSVLNFSLATCYSSLNIMLRDGRKHLSPNSGIPEAAIAGALHITLGGTSTYNGILVEKPIIGNGGCNDYLSASERAVNIIRAASFLGFCIASGALIARALL